MKQPWSLVLLLLALSSTQALSNACDTVYCFDALVVGIADGDTVTVLTEFSGTQEHRRVRLTEIDTPERGQPWSARARQALSNKVFGRQVRVADQGEDRYGRLLGRIYVGDRDINREMIREGHAWVYRQYSSDVFLLQDEHLAKEQKRGLWSLPDAERVPPWEWRRASRQPSTANVGSTPAVASFRCGDKTYCPEMTSCEEARFFFRRCGLTRLDDDGDGVPCERICRN